MKNGDLPESFVTLSASGVGRVELIDLHHFGVSFFFFLDGCTGSSSWLSLLAPLLNNPLLLKHYDRIV